MRHDRIPWLTAGVTVRPMRAPPSTRPLGPRRPVRVAVPSDAARVHALMQQVRAETPFLMPALHEGPVGVDAQRQQLEAMLGGDTRRIFVAEPQLGEPLAGFVGIKRGVFAKSAHVGSLVIAVTADYWRQGLGRDLVACAEAWARRHGICRLELTVVARNHRAVRLYAALGFVQEGLRRGGLCVDGRLEDELYMAKLL